MPLGRVQPSLTLPRQGSFTLRLPSYRTSFTLPAARKEPAPVNAGRLVFGARARRPGLRQWSTAWPKSLNAPVATTAATWVTNGWSSRLPAVEGLADVHPAGPGETVAAAEPVGPDGQVVAEPVDVDGLAAVLFLPDGQAYRYLCAGVEPAVRAGVLAPGPWTRWFLVDWSWFLVDWSWCLHLNVRVGDSRRRP